jgi:transcriptional regulator with XRE-family HTH domain
MNSFGERLRNERKRLNLTQTEFANLGGYQKNAQGEYENDEKSPTAAVLLKLLAAGVDVGYLFYGVQTDLMGSERLTDILRVLSDLPPMRQAMAFGMLTMLARDSAAGAASVADADVVWRATTLFDLFMRTDERGRSVLEMSAKGVRQMTDKP